MAVDKNFVVRNGLEVNSDLIVTDTSDSSNKKVGIASTAPRVTLDVRGGIAATDLNVTGVATIATVDINAGDIEVSQIDATSINVAGITTLANVAITNVNISGVATFADITYDEISGRNLNLTGIATIPSQANLNVTGLATIPTISNTPSFSGGAVVTGVVTASQFSGDGSQLTGIGVGIKTSGGTIGFGFTTLNFIGSGNTFAVNGTTVDISIAGGGGGGGGSASIGIGTTVGDAFSGIVTAGNLWYNTGEGRLFIYYQDATSAQWIDAAPFNVGIITTLQDVAFAAGSAAAPSITFNNDADSGFFQAATNQPGVAAAGSQVARFNPGGLNVTGITTATGFKVGAAISVTDGAVSATRFHGDGSNLTGIDASSLKSGSDIKAQAVGTGVVVTGVLTATTMSASNAVFDGNVTVGGTITYQDATSIDVLGIGTFQQGIQILANGANVTGIVTVGLTTIKTGEIEVTGVVTATTVKAGTAISITNGAVSATRFHGDGSNLTGIDATSLKDSGGNIKVQANPNGIVITGIATATDFDSTSDVRLKTNIQVVDGALDKVNRLRGVSFDWKESGESSYGVIAQELESVLPELVHGDDPKRVNYNGIIGVLIESVKELSAKIDELENK